MYAGINATSTMKLTRHPPRRITAKACRHRRQQKCEADDLKLRTLCADQQRLRMETKVKNSTRVASLCTSCPTHRVHSHDTSDRRPLTLIRSGQSTNLVQPQTAVQPSRYVEINKVDMLLGFRDPETSASGNMRRYTGYSSELENSSRRTKLRRQAMSAGPYHASSPCSLHIVAYPRWEVRRT